MSTATVSYVLNNHDHNMSPETRARVLDAIRALGYRPGVVPAAGAARRAQTIGVFLFLWMGETPLTSNPYAVRLLDGILSTAMPQLWNVALISINAWEDARAQVRASVDGRCDGFILIGPRSGLEITEALSERGYPYVLVNSGSNDPTVDSVDVDNVAAACEMTLRLVAMGHKHIAFLPGGENLDDTNERLQGFRQAFAEAGLPNPEPWVLHPGSYDMRQSNERIQQFLDRRAALPAQERPSALFCGNDNLAYLAKEVMHERGVAVPGDISLIGFDDIPPVVGAGMDLPLTTVRQPLRDIGARATELLLERIAAVDTAKSGVPRPHPVTEFLPHELIFRGSVAPKN